MKRDDKKEVKKNFELDIINLLKKGLRPSQIAVKLNISMPNLQYYLSSLKKKKVIEKVGYGTWKIIPSGEVKILSHKGNLQVKDTRGHAFIWTIKPDKNLKWKELLDSKKISYEEKGIAKTPRIIINGKKVWLGKNKITLYEPSWNSFFANNPIESKKQAVFDMIDVVDKIKEIGGDFKYKFSCKRQHYGFINNKDAIHFNKKGKKILIKNEKGYWFSIDHSQNKYMEAETIHEKDADVDGMAYQRYMNSHEKTSFKVTPEFVLEALNKVSQNQVNNELQLQQFTKQIKSHLELINEYRKENISWRKEKVKEIKKELKEGKQLKLGDWI